MSITDAEYEDAYAEALLCLAAYAEALLCLADDGHAVGTPFYNGTRARYCIVDDRKLTDKDVLELWWEDIASDIMEGR